ncbi:hypothetical protein FQN50_008235 [Emmonsiellopsis sp. PD_5]|nr:hypothetical protein FQN50_008235 [Emmonsiellopsis sp. PD_5]
MAPSLSDLPAELLHLVGTYLSSSHGPDSESSRRKARLEARGSLNALTKTSKYLRSTFEPILYRSIAMDDFQPGFIMFPVLFRTILDRPQLGSWIEELYIEEVDTSKSRPLKYDLTKHFTKAHFIQMGNLITSLISSANEAPESSYKGCLGMLRACKKYPTDVMFMLLASRLLPNLKHLSLKFTQRRIERILHYFRLPGSVKSLRMNWIEYAENCYPRYPQIMDPEDILNQLLSVALSAPENLESLYYEQCYSDNSVNEANLPKITSVLESSVGPTISSLVLIIFQDTPGDWRSPQQLDPDLKDDQPLGSLKQFTNLKRLETQIELLYRRPNRDKNGKPTHNLMDILPAQLEEFRVWTLTHDGETPEELVWYSSDISSLLVEIATLKGTEEKEGLPPSSSLKKIIIGDPRGVAVVPFYATPIHDYEFDTIERETKARNSLAEEWSLLSSIHFEYPRDP